MPELTAIKEHRYGGTQRFPGDNYEATDKDAKLLKAVGRAKDKGSARKSPVDLPDEVMSRKVEEAPAEPEAPLPEPNTYLRRDMQAAGQIGETAQSSLSRPGRRPKRSRSED